MEKLTALNRIMRRTSKFTTVLKYLFKFEFLTSGKRVLEFEIPDLIHIQGDS